MSSDVFAPLAQGYDERFAHRELGRWLRARVHERLAQVLPAGGRVLDLGCGSGEDALWLAGRGHPVEALDVSPAMLRTAETKARAAGLAGRIRFRQQDLDQGVDPQAGPAAAALLDFGALNAVADRPALARRLHAALSPGAPLVAVVMGPLCPWEIASELLHLRPFRAFRRLRSGRRARLPGGGAADGPRVFYPTPGRLAADLSPWFRRLALRGIGTLLPASAMGGLVERWPRLFAALRPLDAGLGDRAASAWLSDHYEMLLVREGAA
jgi:SAM-dependent methyltransferase